MIMSGRLGIMRKRFMMNLMILLVKLCMYF